MTSSSAANVKHRVEKGFGAYLQAPPERLKRKLSLPAVPASDPRPGERFLRPHAESYGVPAPKKVTQDLRLQCHAVYSFGSVDPGYNRTSKVLLSATRTESRLATIAATSRRFHEREDSCGKLEAVAVQRVTKICTRRSSRAEAG